MDRSKPTPRFRKINMPAGSFGIGLQLTLQLRRIDDAVGDGGIEVYWLLKDASEVGYPWN